jgi:hypothetical protein
MWVEGGAGGGSVVYFCAVSTLETSLVCVLEATSGFLVLGPGKFLLATQVPEFISPKAIHMKTSGCLPNVHNGGGEIAH